MTNLRRSRSYTNLDTLEANTAEKPETDFEIRESNSYLKLTTSLVGSLAFGATVFLGFKTMNPALFWTMSTAALTSTTAGIYYGAKIVRRKLQEREWHQLLDHNENAVTEAYVSLIIPETTPTHYQSYQNQEVTDIRLPQATPLNTQNERTNSGERN